jgi:hypothetical protein
MPRRATLVVLCAECSWEFTRLAILPRRVDDLRTVDKLPLADTPCMGSLWMEAHRHSPSSYSWKISGMNICA